MLSSSLHICHCSPPRGRGSWAPTHFSFLVGGRLFRGVDSPAGGLSGLPHLLAQHSSLHPAFSDWLVVAVRGPPAGLGMQHPASSPGRGGAWYTLQPDHLVQVLPFYLLVL